jgi:restriction endonuclease
MAKAKLFNWHLLEAFHFIGISQEDHHNTNFTFINTQLREVRKAWREIKKQATITHEQFLEDQASDYALRLNTSVVNALKAIKNSELSRRDYAKLRQILGHRKDKLALTQISIMDPITQQMKLVTEKHELETSICERNQNHARQALHTPIASDPIL